MKRGATGYYVLACVIAALAAPASAADEVKTVATRPGVTNPSSSSVRPARRSRPPCCSSAARARLG